MLNANALLATEGVKSVFKFRYVELSLTQNYSSFRETRNLLFKGRTQILNNLVAKKVAAGKLKNIKFNIQIYDAVISRPQLIIRQHKKRYEVILSGYPSLQQLYGIIAYTLAHNKNLEYTGENAEANISRFYTQYAKPTSPFTASNFTVWSKSALSLRYTADSLQYRFNNMPLPYRANANLALKTKDRFLVFTSDAILVIKQGRQIAMISLQKPANADFDCNVHTGWVNICDGGPQNWLYTYSYKQNKFFTNPKYIQ
ncbi:MAG: hypothetical protein V4456_05310 [Bacteroidota bacterium]